ncbi:TPA: hypothetical protein ACO6US_003785 [Escherichia albertii]|uniref:hypothetical protein n=1 Tax=Escherichia albertii TaxID=208962 RepID=UPI00074433CB|nr:hypothetical protein [Escherichia albertii]EEX4923878.1 hypothetical protein [Escherichia albertii]EFO1265975.1 hypothetical protein [Escherichia albertii]
MAHDENSIRILTLAETLKFDWHRTEQLAEEYRVPVQWVKRCFEVSRQMEIGPEYFINRYLLKADIPLDPEFEQAFIEIIRENRQC